jgi:hypothetical protein
LAVNVQVRLAPPPEQESVKNVAACAAPPIAMLVAKRAATPRVDVFKVDLIRME